MCQVCLGVILGIALLLFLIPVSLIVLQAYGIDISRILEQIQALIERIRAAICPV